MSVINKILDKRINEQCPMCPGCQRRMRMMRGNCPNCGAGFGLGMGAKDPMSEANGIKIKKIDNTIRSVQDIKDFEDKSKENTSAEDTAKSKRRTKVDWSSDYKLDKQGRKTKAHTIVFNKGEDDVNKKVQEEMKKTYKNFTEKYVITSTDAEINEVLSKDAAAGEWISDFVHSDNPKFAGKSKEKRKQMALAAYYAKQKNEEISFTGSHQGKTTLKHIKNPTVQQRMMAHDIKPGVAGYRDRIDLLKDAERTGKMKKEDLDEAREYLAVHPKTDKVEHVSDSKEARDEFIKSKGSMHKAAQAMTGQKKVGDKYMREDAELEEGWDWKAAPEAPKAKKTTSTYHNIKQTLTGAVYTKQFNKDDTSKGSGGDAAAKAEGQPKRGRGRPKKDKFAEAVDMLLSFPEDQFDIMMEEGFDAFFDALNNLDEEQLDELKTGTLLRYSMKANKDSLKHGILGARARDMGDDETAAKHLNKRDSRDAGVAKAKYRLPRKQ